MCAVSRMDELLDRPPPGWARRFWFDPHDDVARRRYAVVVLAVLGAGLLGFVLAGSRGPADPMLLADTARSGVEGFDEMAFTIRPSPLRTDADALEATVRCALLASTAEQRSQGLQDRSDLGGYDAMLFRFDSDVTFGFHMRNVPVDLSIAWFDTFGRFLGAADMAACPSGDGCDSYFAPAPYRYALEVPKGDFAAMGVGDGSRLRLRGVCPPAAPTPVG